MGRPSFSLACLVIVLVGGIGCAAPTPSVSPSAQSGGTLRVGFTGDPSVGAIGFTGDPQALADFAYEDPGQITPGYLLRCCLARTPLVYPGLATSDGGTLVQPDLATAMPEVSADGKTWTLHLRSGIRYAPPYADLEVTAADIVHGAERAVRLIPDAAFIGSLQYVTGAIAVANGEATTISGLQATDAQTLVIKLDRPYGGFGILADPVWSPIPESAITAHDADMGIYWPSSGPYMYETYPADPLPTTAVLVRNPSWDRASDPRRRAWVDRIEISYAGDPDQALAAVEAGDFDLLDFPAPADVADRYRGDPSLATRMRSTNTAAIFWLPMNLAVPPFDDVAVRRAVNLAVERRLIMERTISARVEEQGPQRPGYIVGHVFPNGLTDGLLVGYDPFESNFPDMARAHDEMARSRYDADHDGVCDAAVCQNVRMPASDTQVFVAIQQALAELGIDIQFVNPADDNDMANPHNRTAIQANTFGWGYSLTGSDLALLLRGGDTLSRAAQDSFTINASLVGAQPEDLAAWGYSVTEVPSVDDVIDRCETAIGHQRAMCWSELDQLVTESIVPWIPLFTFESDYVSSARVAGFSLDQSLFREYPALDRVSLAP